MSRSVAVVVREAETRRRLSAFCCRPRSAADPDEDSVLVVGRVRLGAAARLAAGPHLSTGR
jgi:hypothetical protein